MQSSRWDFQFSTFYRYAMFYNYVIVFLTGMRSPPGSQAWSSSIGDEFTVHMYIKYNFEVIKVYGRKMFRSTIKCMCSKTIPPSRTASWRRTINSLSWFPRTWTLDKITRFARGANVGEGEHAVDLSIIAEASRKSTIANRQMSGLICLNKMRQQVQ